MSLHPPQVCVPCRDCKRKCDKAQPCCSLCRRLRRDCSYELGSQETHNHQRNNSNRILNSPSRSCALVKGHPKLSSGLDNLAILPSNVDSDITDQLLKLVGNLSGVQHVFTKYFNTIHLWMPIISEPRILDRLPRVFLEPQADLSLLTLSIALATTVPVGIDVLSLASPLYTLVKSSIAVVEAANIHSLEVLQSRLLLSLFEVGHGINPAAYITLAATARAAAAMGANLSLEGTYTGGQIYAERSDEALCVWWAIVILDRYYTLERGIGPCATGPLGQPTQLPRDKTVIAQATLRPNVLFDISAPSSIPIGPFARQAQVSHLLNRLLTHIQDPTYDQKFNYEESKLLARTLGAFSKLLPEETPQPWPRYCGAIGMCYSALTLLLESRPRFIKHTDTDFLLEPTLKSTLQQISEIARKFNEQIEFVDTEALSPFVANSLYMAIVAQRKLYRETHDEFIWNSLSSLETMLRHFSRRWSNAGKYLGILNEIPGAR